MADRIHGRFIAVVFASLVFGVPVARAQSAIPAGNAKVKLAALPVYSEMSASSDVVRSLHQGDEVVLDFEFASGAGSWCGVRLPGQAARLGYVDCSGLDISRRDVPAGPFPSGSVAGPEDSSARAGNPPSARPRIHLSLAPPVARVLAEYRQVTALVVREGVIDTVKLDQLDAAAQSHSAAAMARAALAHDAAGNFDLSQSESGKAIEQFHSALNFAGNDTEILFATLVSLAYVHLLRSEFSTALEFLVRARALAPESVAVAQLSGWAFYGLDRSAGAVEQWRKAQRLEPNPQVASLLEKAERDREVEKGFQQGETTHFVLRYQGAANPALARDILSTLENDFRTIESTLQFSPPERIGIVLYTEETFRDVTRAPRWSGGINDGRVRLPVQGLTSVNDELARVLTHELTHSFVRQMTQGRCPQWLNEGLAEWMEGRRSAADAQALVGAYDQKNYIPLSRLEGPWNGFPPGVARFAYDWALAAVEAIIANSGMWGIERLLEGVAQGTPMRDALGPALQRNYADLELETVQYLRRTYLASP